MKIRRRNGDGGLRRVLADARERGNREPPCKTGSSGLLGYRTLCAASLALRPGAAFVWLAGPFFLRGRVTPVVRRTHPRESFMV